MSASPYRDAYDPWRDLYIAETSETSQLRNEVWALRREVAELRSTRLAIILVVPGPANDNTAEIVAEDRRCLTAAILGAAIMLFYLLLFT